MIAAVLPAAFPGPVAAWLGASQAKEPAKALGMRFLHTGLLQDEGFREAVYEMVHARVWQPGCSYLRDNDRCIVTIGLSGEPSMGDETVDALGQLWLARAARCARLAIPALERWLARQLQHLPVGRPYGSRIFARVREAALFGGDVTLAARVDALADRVRPMLESRPDELIASLVCGPRVLMSRGHSSDGTRQ